MKIEELSIGDFLFFTDGDCAVRVEEIYNDAQLLISDGDSISEPVHLTHLHPIPLTPEILEKNGFVIADEFADCQMYGSPECSIVHTKGTMRYCLEAPQASVVCYNVHQLQHTLRLAGIEKEIEV